MRWRTIGGRTGFVACSTGAGLDASDGWLEAPFWIWSTEDPLRRPLYARQMGDAVVITDRRSHEISLAIADDRDASTAAQQIAELSARRHQAADAGANDDVVCATGLERLVSAWNRRSEVRPGDGRDCAAIFGFDPPEFGTVSATLRLPIACESQVCVHAGDLQHRIRDLQYHPSCLLTVTAIGPLWKGSFPTKRRWLEVDKTPENAGAAARRDCRGQRGASAVCAAATRTIGARARRIARAPAR